MRAGKYRVGIQASDPVRKTGPGTMSLGVCAVFGFRVFGFRLFLNLKTQTVDGPENHIFHWEIHFGSDPKFSGPTRKLSFCLDLLQNKFSGRSDPTRKLSFCLAFLQKKISSATRSLSFLQDFYETHVCCYRKVSSCIVFPWLL